ncbi:Ribonuclease BN, tRNA processing enzyme [Nonomuraea solani]|uniref:Ribonuclease BN, tRNA processing enzyme n=1 Tax=Nonomuraea solani TaxID=1144553 RepID=A0A1H6EXU4_9ACTN|nr:MBL fold metallo-hydrolase [Nonomuraea solani]SEH01786.1 Ribonuclease BN, tRNA processing enzyme [Nonomuraea solani]
MRLHLIGTGSILSTRMSASALVDGTILIDAPNGAMKALHRDGLDPAGIDICLITHFHADHFFDIVFLFLEQGLLRTRDSELVLIGPGGFGGRVEHLFELAYPGSWPHVKENTRPRFVELGDGGEWSGNGYTVRALPTRHTVPSLGYLITDAAGTRLGYTGDTVLCPAVEELAGQSAALVLDTSFHQSKAGHMGLDDVEALADRHPGLPLIATHRDDDVTSSSRPAIHFPGDGQTYHVTADGL